MHIVGVDIGATKINFVLVKNNRILKTKKIQTPHKKEEVISTLKENIKSISKDLKVRGIGIGVPGPLNVKGDLILNPPNLKCLRNCPLAKIIEKGCGIKTRMDNDVNCFTLGEAVLGAGRGAKVVFGITLGSGVGGGIVMNGKIYRGVFGSAGEVGHMTIKFDGPRCSCSSFGCFEEYCSERFFKKKGFLPSEKRAQNLYNEYGKYLGMGLSNVINLLDPEVIVIGGGLSNAWKLFVKETKKEIKKRVISPFPKKNVKIKKAKLGELAGAIGAALLW